ncbi:MAG: hypothetical protein J5966_10830 [Lachnospiraceae bacterium]|nr:hypothetical protein [Lachnospiraceae bacterium]
MSYNREYRSSVFAMLFEDRENLLDLYNGVYGGDCGDPEEISINTLKDQDGVESGIFMRVRNDISFVFEGYLNLFEHQSTKNSNIPIRMLLYTARLIYNLVTKRALYRTDAVKIPAPRFAVFYNGRAGMPERTELKLSDLYEVDQEAPDLELKVTLYNINIDAKAKILENSRILREYSIYVERTRKALEGKATEAEKREAMSRVIDECIADGILAGFLTDRRDEVMMTSIFQYDQEAHEWALHEDGYDEGHADGMRKGLQQGLQQGIQQGLQQGMEQGIQQGIKQGEAERARLEARIAVLEAELGSPGRK